MLNINKIVEADKSLGIQIETARIRSNGDADICVCKNRPRHRHDAGREFRQRNPNLLCLNCDGYNYDCSDYATRQ